MQYGADGGHNKGPAGEGMETSQHKIKVANFRADKRLDGSNL